MGRGEGGYTAGIDIAEDSKHATKTKITKSFDSKREVFKKIDPGQGKILIMCGIPGSGKSTYSDKLMEEDSQIVRVSADSIRKELFASLKEANAALPEIDKKERDRKFKEANNKVFSIFNKRIKAALHNKKTVIADATHLTPFARKNMRELATKTNAASELVLFQDVKLAFEQNKLRDEDAIVPDYAMDRMKSNFFKTKEAVKNNNEGYNAIRYVSIPK